MNKTRTPTGGHISKAWRLKKKHKKAMKQCLDAMNKVIRTELPLFIQKEAEANIGLFRPPVFDLIRKRRPQ